MPQFSPDQTVRGARFSPAAGNIGAQAAQRAARPASARKDTEGISRSKRETPRLGHPTFPDEKPEGPRDNSHLEPIGQHFNMQSLGREVPFAVWASLTGNYRQWAKPGQLPFDIFEAESGH